MMIFVYWGILILCYFIASRLRNMASRFGFLDKSMHGSGVYTGISHGSSHGHQPAGDVGAGDHRSTGSGNYAGNHWRQHPDDFSSA